MNQTPGSLADRANWAARVGGAVLEAVRSVGDLTRFTGQMFAWLVARRPARDRFVPVLYQVGVRSVPVVMITGAFIGMDVGSSARGKPASPAFAEKASTWQ